jgi:hypothetical protein
MAIIDGNQPPKQGAGKGLAWTVQYAVLERHDLSDRVDAV